MSACTSSSGTSARVGTAGLTEDEKHRLYAAALTASEFPLENETFKEVCRKIGIFDADGKQNDNYMDVSVVVAKAPSASTGGGGGGGADGCSGGYSIRAPSSVAAGSRIKIRFGYSGAQPGGDAWIGLFFVGTNRYSEWYGVKAMPGCEGTFTAPGPGNYEFRYLLDSGFDKVAARASITVQ
jgi:hypothetical protein